MTHSAATLIASGDGELDKPIHHSARGLPLDCRDACYRNSLLTLADCHSPETTLARDSDEIAIEYNLTVAASRCDHGHHLLSSSGVTNALGLSPTDTLSLSSATRQ